MFTDKAQTVVDLAKDFAFSGGAGELTVQALLAAIGRMAEPGVLLAESLGLSPEALRAACPDLPDPASCPGKIALTEATREVLVLAKELAQEVPDRLHPGLVDLSHLVAAMAASAEVCTVLGVTPLPRDAARERLAAWTARTQQTPRLDQLTERLRGLRAELLTRVFGQDHAVHAFVEGLFNAEVVAAADTARKAPRAVFVFAGPPGVGKTFLAELGASYLDRPFKRFDMSAYAGHQQGEALVGMGRSYHAAHGGTLTEFVEKNPGAVLLFDEIEKAHPTTIQLFLQILDAGNLEDKFHERLVPFRDTLIIFTTNAGRKLYDRPNSSGVHTANAAFHRRTILDALETEINPLTREPFFPAAICSRMATGYPVLFNHLRVNELDRVVRAELDRVARLLEVQYYKRVTYDDLLSLCLVLREGAQADARTLRSQAETFVKTELFKFCQLFKTDRLEEVFGQADSIHLALDEDPAERDPDVAALFEPAERPRVLLVGGDDLTALYARTVDAVQWRTAGTAEDALRLLAEEEIDLVLLDLWIGRAAHSGTVTLQHFDHVPAAARRLDVGQETLKKIRERLPHIPVFLLSLTGPGPDGASRASVDDELLLACVRGGGARGMITSDFTDDLVTGWEKGRDRFAESLVRTCRRLHRERAAQRMGEQRKVLTFDTVPHVDRAGRAITIRLRNLRLARALAAADAGEVLQDVERPRARFDDVIGAGEAKEELGFFVNYLKNPRRFAALGLKPPRGVLLYGPPGTGKTLLARAMAGECNVAFLPVSATNFVTIWQGSGPQNVRDLFERARRYAPAIIFIDEIDAVGAERTGGAGAGRAEEGTLNALLTEMDGFVGPSPDRPIFVLAATNFPIKRETGGGRALDPALVRRFSRTIEVSRPDTAARRLYLERRLAQGNRVAVTPAMLDLLAEKTVGMSVAELEHVIDTAARQAARAETPITEDMLNEALDTVRLGEKKEWKPEFLESTARHEAGHTLLYWLSGHWAPEVSIVARGGSGGRMWRFEEQESYTRDELLASIRTSLGGRAAELVTYGPRRGLSTGASSDIAGATNLARRLICEFGMDDAFGPMAMTEFVQDAGLMGSPLGQQITERVRELLAREMERTMALVTEHRAHLDALAQALMAKNRLGRTDLQALLPPPPAATEA
jgi:ATP-dependent metalloprotease FtsH